VENSGGQAVVLVSGGATILAGSDGPLTIPSWALGRRYTSPDGTGEYVTGLVEPAPQKPASLLDSTGAYFQRSKPQYETYGSTAFVVATAHGISNGGTGDQTAAINSLLASSVGTPVFFPAGVYLVAGTVFVPVGSIIVGEGWSQVISYEVGKSLSSC
jgi:glucan 1,3-beta-glucosidase